MPPLSTIRERWAGRAVGRSRCFWARSGPRVDHAAGVACEVICGHPTRRAAAAPTVVRIARARRSDDARLIHTRGLATNIKSDDLGGLRGAGRRLRLPDGDFPREPWIHIVPKLERSWRRAEPRLARIVERPDMVQWGLAVIPPGVFQNRPDHSRTVAGPCLWHGGAGHYHWPKFERPKSDEQRPPELIPVRRRTHQTGSGGDLWLSPHSAILVSRVL